MLFLRVKGAFTEKIKEAVRSGVLAQFTFFVRFYEVREFWFDEKIADMTIIHTIKYDNLKKKFIVKRSWENNQPVVTSSFDEAQALMSRIDSLKIAERGALEKGGQYQIKAKAELNGFTASFPLRYILFFVSPGDFETDWHAVDFIY